MTILAFIGALVGALVIPGALALQLRAEAMQPALRPVTVRARRRLH